jgi:hypothetical protein
MGFGDVKGLDEVIVVHTAAIEQIIESKIGQLEYCHYHINSQAFKSLRLGLGLLFLLAVLLEDEVGGAQLLQFQFEDLLVLEVLVDRVLVLVDLGLQLLLHGLDAALAQ